MDKRFEQETEKLVKSWQQYDEQMLRDYLVEDVEDPRINVQSILTRHFLIEALLGPRVAELKDHELRFAAVMNWLLDGIKQAVSVADYQSLGRALAKGSDHVGGWEIPPFVHRTFLSLPASVDGFAIPNYLDAILSDTGPVHHGQKLDEAWLGTFQSLWHDLLAREQHSRLSLLEPACGSANDYRFFDAFGLARFLDYTGFDLCEKNIRNAQAMFPQARFAVGNALAIDAPDQAFDYCFVHDLFEHLSVEAMQLAAAEICRVTRKGFCLGFFRMHEGEDHIVRPVDDYYLNALSMARIRELFEDLGFGVQVIHIDTFLQCQFGCDQTHNRNAYTLMIRR